MISLKDNTRRQADELSSEAESDRALMRRAPAWQDRWWFTEDGLRLYARDYPAAPGRVRLPVVCLHGLTRNSADFEDVAGYISKADRRVIVPDMRGRGLSENDSDPMNYNVWTYAKDVLSLCDGLGIGQAIFVGTSMGGLVTMVLSTLRPNLIRAAVLNDVGPVLSPKGLSRISGFARTRPSFRNWHDAAVFIAEQNRQAFPNHTPADWLKFARRVCLKGKDGLLHLAFDPRITETFDVARAAAGTYDMTACFASLAANRKLLLVRGALSDVLDEAAAKRMTAAAPDMKRVDVDYTGHAPMLTEPPARAAIADFLESLP